jgi:hypothetical protein
MSGATAFLSHSSKDKPLVEEVANALCQPQDMYVQLSMK